MWWFSVCFEQTLDSKEVPQGPLADEKREVTGGGAPGSKACSNQEGLLLSVSYIGVRGKGLFD